MKTVVTGVENADVSIGTAVDGQPSDPPDAAWSMEKLSGSFSFVGFAGKNGGRASAPVSRPRTPGGSPSHAAFKGRNGGVGRGGSEAVKEEGGGSSSAAAPASGTSSPAPPVAKREIDYSAFARDSAFRDS